MRFVLLKTKNNQAIINALGDACDAIDLKNSSSQKATEEATREILDIAERNVTRRKIRLPRLFSFAIVPRIYRRLYNKKTSHQYAYILDQLKTDTNRVAIVFNGYLAPNALLQLAAEKLNMRILFVENGFYPKTMQCDISGINALSTLPRDSRFYDQLDEQLVGNTWPKSFETRKSKLKPSNAKQNKLPETYTFVPFQVPSDMQVLALSPWIGDMVHLYNEIAKLAVRYPNENFVIKEHPSFPLSIIESVEQHPNIHFCNHAETKQLIEASKAVITINSTVGLEALTLGKKVITLGDAHYAIDDVVLEANCSETLAMQFQALENWQPNIERRDNFVRFVYGQFLLPTSIKEPAANLANMLADRASQVDQYSRLLKDRSS